MVSQAWLLCLAGLAAEEAGILDNRALNDPAAMPACTEVMERKPKREQYLKRYREKKRRRLHAKTIRYHKRKLNADRRYAEVFRCLGEFRLSINDGCTCPYAKICEECGQWIHHVLMACHTVLNKVQRVHML